MGPIRKAYIDTSIGQVHYRYVGDGEPLLLVHQSLTCSEVFEPLMGLLAPDFLVLAVDTPGFGMSAMPPPTFSIPDYGRVFVEFLDALEIESAHVFGHHTGATFATELAASSPERVNKLVLSKPQIWSDDEERERYAPTVRQMVLDHKGSYLKDVWDAVVLDQQGDALDLEAKHRELVWRLKGGPGFAALAGAVTHYDRAARLAQIEAPTLVVVGDQEKGIRGAENAARLIKHSRYQVIPGGRNWLEIEKCHELAAILRDFFIDSGGGTSLSTPEA